MNRSRKSFRTLGLVFVLLLAAALGLAATVPKALPAGISGVKEFRKIPPAGVRPFQSFACSSQGIDCNTTVNGELTTDDCQVDPPRDRSFYDAWTFQATAGLSVQITLQSASFDTSVVLYDSNDNQLDYDTSGATSRISFTFENSGTYTIRANSNTLDPVTGAYTLKLICSQGQSPCTADGTTLCLNNGRFRVQAIFSAPNLNITNAPAHAVPLTTDTGYFWFFSSNNVEMVTKVVDGRAFNSRFWVFAGGLTNVAVVMTVTDTQTGAFKTYTNPQDTAFQPIQDTNAFAASATAEPSEIAPTEASEAQAAAQQTAEVSSWLQPQPPPGSPSFSQGISAQAPCAADATTLCLNAGRFKVQTQWTTPQGQSGAGQAVSLTSDTGYFWFFSSNNVEMVVKGLNACTFDSRFWIFAGGLTNVNVVMTVTDTQTGAVKTYTNPQGTAFQPIQDTNAFACP